jgi:PRTRC genetic system protein B
MNTSVNIGSSQDFRLSRALLVYGTSSYQGIPYRHPFVTLHEVIHDGNGARLAEGRLMTPQMLIELMTGLGRSLPIEILPERVLVRTAETIVWWSHAGTRTLFFSERGNDRVLKQINGKRYPQPPLVFKVCGSHLWVRALAEGKRPTAETKLCMAPYWNCYDNGAVCTGSMQIPREKIGVGDRRLGTVFLPERVHPCLRSAQAYPLSRRPAGDVAVPRGKGKFPKQVPGEIATETCRIRERQ